jgi:hypothetical protein
LLAIELLVTEWPDAALSTCSVTGRPTNDTVPFNKVFPNTFGDFHLLRMPHGDSVDARIAEILANNYLTWQHWIIANGELRLKQTREDLRQFLFNDLPGGGFGIYVAPDMYRKGALLTPACISASDGVVQFGTQRARIEDIRKFYPEALDWFNRGWTKSKLESLTLPAKYDPAYFAPWMEFAARIRPLMDSTAWRLSVWMLPTQDEVKANEG